MTRILTLYPVKPVQEEKNVSSIDWSQYSRFSFRYREVLLATAILMVIVCSVVFADYLTPHDPVGAMNLSQRFTPPFWVEDGSTVHLLGTDNLGRDVFSRTLHGGWISLQVAFIASTIATVVGMFLGVISGYMGGIVDRILMDITNAWLSFPFMVLALAIIAAVGGSVTVLVVLLSLAGWVHSARVTRAQTLKLRQTEYVHAAIAFGATPLHIMWSHILPGIINVNIIMWTFSLGTVVLIEGSLSFIGMGVSPGTPSWGNMLNEGRDYMRDAWWMSIFPGLFLMSTILAVNFLGDALQKLNNHHS